MYPHFHLNGPIRIGIGLLCLLPAGTTAAFDPDGFTHPRTWVVSGRHEAFRDYCTTGEGAAMFARIKEDFDRDFRDWETPAEPDTYGDPDPRKRTSDKVDKWRAAQDTTGLIAKVAEAATLIWLVTGEDAYLETARGILLATAGWSLDGVSSIHYNDEAHFRLWRKLPLVYDQIRGELTDEEKKRVLSHFRVRGRQSVESIRASGIGNVRRNSIEVKPSSHPVRFMPMTGLAGLALWDDLPEDAPGWWALSRTFYDDQFTPWGGDDGGWAEGPAYWRGVIEHASFEDARLALRDPGAYANPFWRNTGYFPLYFVPPYRATAFGDTPVAGKFNLEPGMAHFIRHLARVFNDGALAAYADLYADPRPLPELQGLGGLDRLYPTAGELLVRQFVASSRPPPPPASLDDLPQSRLFADIGWVSMHSALGRPDEDIMLSFKSSPYGSYSHSHADQNAFILNAYGQNLAINAGYREYHGSPMHREFTRQTLSKNAILINGEGQESQDSGATGRIIDYQTGERFVLATGDATVAYNRRQPDDRVERALRDVLMVDQRFFVIRDRIRVSVPSPVSWLLHAEEPIRVDDSGSRLTITRNGVALLVYLTAVGPLEQAAVQNTFPTPTDPKYAGPGWGEQSHFRADFASHTRHEILSVLWPVPAGGSSTHPELTPTGSSDLIVNRPDGRRTRIQFLETGVLIEDLPTNKIPK